MIAAELRGGNKPSLNEALGWIGSRVDDIYGAAVGRLEDVWIDPGTGAPRWLLVKEGRFGGRSTLIPFGDATAGAGHVWVPYEREVVRQAPAVEPGVPLTQQIEATLRNHYAASAAASSLGDPGRGSAQVRATVRPAASDSPPGPGDPSRVSPPPLPQRPPPPVQPPPQQQHPYEVAPPRQPLQYAQAAPPPPVQPRYEEHAPPPVQAGYGEQPPPPVQPRYEEQPPPPVQPRYEEQPPPPPTYHQPQPAFEPTPPQQAFEPTPPAPMPDPAAVLAAIPAGSQIEIELEGNITIAGNVQSIRITPAERRS